MTDMPTPHALAACPACGSTSFGSKGVLWPGLVAAWQLSEEEVAYVNRQQGFHCRGCGNNLRMMALAAALLRTLGAEGPLARFCESGSDVRVLEVNEAGFLTQFLGKLAGHRLVEHPGFDMMDLAIDSGQFDVVVHSDTLEHVPDPVRGLSECRRVLRDGGACAFTVPMVVGRLTRSRAGLAPIHHGNPDEKSDDQLVRTEFGADAWQHVLRAGFSSCEIVPLDYPAALTLVGTK